jgi:hypothetical protein
MKSKKDIKNIALNKLLEARALYEAGYYDGAFYLGGYCIELALKARICKNLDIDNLFDSKYLRFFKVHDFDTLLMFSGLGERFERAKATNIDLYQNWSYICVWKEDCRYATVGNKTQIEVLQFLNAIDEPSNGFLSWIKKYW